MLVGVGLVLLALLLQSAVVGRLPLPGGLPDLLLVVVAAIALAGGPRVGLGVGFAGGLLADLSADHQLGRLALAYALAGLVAGRGHDTERSAPVAFATVAAAAAVAIVVFAATGALVGDPRTSPYAVGMSLLTSLPYDVLLTPLVVPVVGLLLRPGDSGLVHR